MIMSAGSEEIQEWKDVMLLYGLIDMALDTEYSIRTNRLTSARHGR
jgi:hypothetical protein